MIFLCCELTFFTSNVAIAYSMVKSISSLRSLIINRQTCGGSGLLISPQPILYYTKCSPLLILHFPHKNLCIIPTLIYTTMFYFFIRKSFPSALTALITSEISLSNRSIHPTFESAWADLEKVQTNTNCAERAAPWGSIPYQQRVKDRFLGGQ